MARFVSGTLPRGLRSWRCKDKRTAFCHQSFLRTGVELSLAHMMKRYACAYRMGRVGKVLSGWKSQPLYETLSWDPGTGCQLHLTEQPDHCSLDITHDGWIGDSTTTNRTLSKLPNMVSAANVKVLGLIYVVHERSLAVGMKDGRVFILLSAQSVNEHRHRGRNI